MNKPKWLQDLITIIQLRYKIRGSILCTFKPIGEKPFTELCKFQKTNEYKTIDLQTGKLIRAVIGYVTRQNGETYFMDTGKSTDYIENMPMPFE